MTEIVDTYMKIERECLAMSLKQYSEEQLKEMALVEIAYEIFSEHKTDYIPGANRSSGFLAWNGERRAGRPHRPVLHRFKYRRTLLALSDQTWGLRSWYPYDQLDEETQPTVKAKRKSEKSG